MKIIRGGVTRLVIVVGAYVIKIPNFTHCMLHFLSGCYANWSERDLWKTWRNFKVEEGFNGVNIKELIVPSLFCSWFGLVQVAYKVDVLDRDLTKKECKRFEVVCNGDIKKENFGYYQGRLVCIDYP